MGVEDYLDRNMQELLPRGKGMKRILFLNNKTIFGNGSCRYLPNSLKYKKGEEG